MTVREFEGMLMDTDLGIRDRNSGKYIHDRRERNEYLDKEICGVYARRHGYRRDEKVQIVVMVR